MYFFNPLICNYEWGKVTSVLGVCTIEAAHAAATGPLEEEGPALLDPIPFAIGWWVIMHKILNNWFKYKLNK